MTYEGDHEDGAPGSALTRNPGSAAPHHRVAWSGAAALAVLLIVVWLTAIAAEDGKHASTSTGGHARVVAGTVWVTNEEGNTLSVVDAATATIRVGQGPRGLRPSPDGSRVVVANVGATR